MILFAAGLVKCFAKASGLVKRQVFQTFDNFENVNQEVTMAKNSGKESSWGNANFITPMVLRLLEDGEWVSIRNTADFSDKD